MNDKIVEIDSARGPGAVPAAWEDYRCPTCRSPLAQDDQNSLSCRNLSCRHHQPGSFPVIDNVPVLIDFEQSVVDRSSLEQRGGDSVFQRDPPWYVKVLRRLVNGDNSQIAEANMQRFQNELFNAAPPGLGEATLLVIGGGHLGSNLQRLYETDGIKIVCFDIYRSKLTNFVADAHQIPLFNETVEGVWIQAVLEHVLDPAQVVAEIHRVLAPGGIVYAETPFMQQVHEGAYDFTRFTRSGHRWLFRQFDEIDAGVVAGAGTSLLWSIRYFWRSITGSSRMATLMTSPFFWLRYFDRIRSGNLLSDGASGLYFMGRKSDSCLSPKDIIRYYE